VKLFSSQGRKCFFFRQNTNQGVLTLNVMYQLDDYFVRIREDSSGRLKLTVWNQYGDKVVSDYISAATSDYVWTSIAKNSSESVVENVKCKLMGTC
jgi:hypothetical protein